MAVTHTGGFVWIAGLLAVGLLIAESGFVPRIRALFRAFFRAAAPQDADVTASTDDQVRMLTDTIKIAGFTGELESRATLDLSRLIDGVAAKAGRGRASVVAGRSPLHTVGDAGAFERALTILIENALTHGERCQISCDHGTSAVVVHVDDDGPGVPRDRRARIFDWRYYLSTPPAEQTGSRVELVIAHSIMRAHGGDLAVSASPLGGARFTMQLALAERPADAHHVPALIPAQL